MPETLIMTKKPIRALWVPRVAFLSALLIAPMGCAEKKPAAPAGPPVVALIRAADWMGSEWSEDAIKFGLEEAGLEEGRDFTLQMSSAQGDIGTLPTLLQAAVDAKVAVIVALQDATLQVAVQQVKNTPVVFHLLADPFAAGAGTSDSTHLANFTGVYSPGFGDPAQDRRVQLIRQTLPKAKSVGILFSTDEPLAVELKDKMKAAAERAGLRVAEVGMASINDAQQAADALVSQKVDAIEIYGNSVHTAFYTVIRIAQAAKIPVFSASPFEVMKGATAAIYPDFQEGGTVAGGMVARILKGESPANIPFYQVTTSKVAVNTGTGTAVPAEVKNEASKVVGDSAKP
jgi:ABC-type uncharacterized transport system substrate-binding protein